MITKAQKTALNSRIRTIKSLLSEHFAIHIQLANCRIYLETKQSYLQNKYYGCALRIKDKMDEANSHLHEASRLMREIRTELEQELAAKEEKLNAYNTE